MQRAGLIALLRHRLPALASTTPLLSDLVTGFAACRQTSTAVAGTVGDSTPLGDAIGAALGRRRRLVGLPNVFTTAFRAVAGEADGAPGVVVDVYGDASVITLDDRAPPTASTHAVAALTAEGLWGTGSCIVSKDQAGRTHILQEPSQPARGALEEVEAQSPSAAPTKRVTLHTSGVPVRENGIYYEDHRSLNLSGRAARLAFRELCAATVAAKGHSARIVVLQGRRLDGRKRLNTAHHPIHNLGVVAAASGCRNVLIVDRPEFAPASRRQVAFHRATAAAMASAAAPGGDFLRPAAGVLGQHIREERDVSVVAGRFAAAVGDSVPCLSFSLPPAGADIVAVELSPCSTPEQYKLALDFVRRAVAALRTPEDSQVAFGGGLVHPATAGTGSRDGGRLLFVYVCGGHKAFETAATLCADLTQFAFGTATTMGSGGVRVLRRILPGPEFPRLASDTRVEKYGSIALILQVL